MPVTIPALAHLKPRLRIRTNHWIAATARTAWWAGGAVALLSTVLSLLVPEERLSISVLALNALVTWSVFLGAGWLTGLVTMPITNNKLGLWLGRALVAMIMTVGALHHFVGQLIHTFTSVFPSVDTWQIFSSNPEQFWIHAQDGYTAHLWAFGLGSIAFLSACFALLTWFNKSEQATSWRRIILTLLAPLALIVQVRATELPVWLQVYTPEIAFMTSVMQQKGERVFQNKFSQTSQGPRLSTEKDWKTAVRETKGEKPNFLLMVLESVPHDHVGYEGYPRRVTPNLDAIAACSLRFHRVWAASTHSNYAQMAILSSQWPRRRTFLDTYRILDYRRFLPHDLFSLLGYRTATISSQNENWQGMRRFQRTKTKTLFKDSHDHPGPRMGRGSEAKLPDHLTTDEVLDWLANKPGKPWSLYLNFQRTHFPYTLPKGFKTTYNPSNPSRKTFGYLHYPEKDKQKAINRFDNALAYVDEQIGRISDYLEQTKQLENTLWVITSDHGESFFDTGIVTHGKTLREPESRAPLLFHWPEKLKSGDIDIPTSHIDIMPTVTHLLGLKPHPSFQGKAAINAAGDTDSRQPLFMTMQGLRHADGVICFPYKFVHDLTDKRKYLYRLDRDPNEKRNLYSEASPKARALDRLLQRQIDLQLYYYAPETKSRKERFQPRFLPCP